MTIIMYHIDKSEYGEYGIIPEYRTDNRSLNTKLYNHRHRYNYCYGFKSIVNPDVIVPLAIAPTSLRDVLH